jgi:ABC-2 type transport system permease protein
MSTATATVEPGTRTARPAPAPIPFTRLVSVELRKMFDTRAGFWLLASIAITAVLATGAVILFAPDAAITYESFGTAVGVPMSIVLPIIAILGVTGEWSQRTGLTTFTLVPHRERVILAKLVGAVVVGAVAMPLAMLIGALGNLLGSTLAGVDTVWDMSLQTAAQIVLASVLGMLIGFMLGVLLRSSAGAIVGYFVYGFVLPGLLGALAAFQEWFADIQPWVDFNFAIVPLYDGSPTAEQWAQMAVSGSFWLLLPLAVGLWLVRHSEVK